MISLLIIHMGQISGRESRDVISVFRSACCWNTTMKSTVVGKNLKQTGAENIVVLSWTIVIVYAMPTIRLFSHMLLYMQKDKVFLPYWIYIIIMNVVKAKECGKTDSFRTFFKNSATKAESGRKCLPDGRELNWFSNTKWSVLEPCIQAIFYSLLGLYLGIYVHVHIHVCI